MMDEQYHVHDLLAAYVLGAATSEEASLVEEHLTTCALCRGQAREFRQVERALPRLAGELAPPPVLKARLMSVVEAEARTRGATAMATLTRTATALEAPASLDDASPNGATPIPLFGARTPSGSTGRAQERPAAARRRGVPLGAIVALAAALLLVALGVGLWRVIDGAPQPESVYAFADPSKTPLGTLKYYSAGNRLELNLHGLKRITPGHVYELWLISTKGGKPVAVKGIGVFPAPGGTGSLAKNGQDLHGYNLAGLTVERRFSPDKPTLPIVATASITT